MISAKIIADSIANDIRITTMELCYQRFIHSEMMTHRMFSRNASSSRAIPVAKMLEQVAQNLAMPIHWGKNQPGMQAKEELTGIELELAQYDWILCARHTHSVAKLMNEIGVHKQVINRLLEPFQWIKVIVTATEWEGFFKLRLHPDAQPEIQELAKCMKEAMEVSSPKELALGEWHLPYVTMQYPDTGQTSENNESLEECIKMSVARCARVSYLNHDNTSPDIAKDIALADKLLEAGHMSPFEHIATPMKPNKEDTYYSLQEGVTHIDRNGDEWSGNFRGFLQYRQLLNGL